MNVHTVSQEKNLKLRKHLIMTTLRLVNIEIKEFIIITVVLFNLQCQGNQEASVEKINGTSRILVPLHMEELVGLRDSETVDIEVKFLGNSGVTRDDGLNSPDSLMLRIQLRFGVPTQFQSGSFRWYQKDEFFQGPITSMSVTYYGGQGGLPSMDGRFQFGIIGHGRYETFIPTTEIVRP